MNILSIESSCDETGVAFLEDTVVLASELSSQIRSHQVFGGVVPELASRLHTESIHVLITRCLTHAGKTLEDVDVIAVTNGPGLEGALLVGLTAAKTLSALLNVPVIGINHLHGHIYAPFLEHESLSFPFISLIVSGGHTQLVHIDSHFNFELLGQTRDDAVGEAFDKVARILDLGYPGGPKVEALAKEGSPTIQFPLPMINQGLEFSFSGLKTAVLQTVTELKSKGTLKKADICASFQQAVFKVVLKKITLACNQFNTKTVVITGGVAANQTMATFLTQELKKNNITCVVPARSLCTDNASMIGIAAYYAIQKKLKNESFSSFASHHSSRHLGSVTPSLAVDSLNE